MDKDQELRDQLIDLIQNMSVQDLNKIKDLFLVKAEKENTKEKTLQLAGSWEGLPEDLFEELTDKLHEKRLNDRFMQ